MDARERGGIWRRRPDADEYAPYYGPYVAGVPDGDVVAALAAQLDHTLELLDAVPPERETWRYAPDKWSIREVVGHLADVERVFVSRALWFARGDPGPLPGMEQDDWVRASNAGERDLGDLLEEWEIVRRGAVQLFRSLGPEAARRRGVANGVEFTVSAIAWVIAGHELHHRRVLLERYRLGS